MHLCYTMHTVCKSHSRDLLVALNLSADLRREAICRLGGDLAHHSGDGWPPAPAELSARTGVRPGPVRRALSLLRPAPGLARAEYRRAADLGATILTRLDPAYPGSLLELPEPPPVLYVRGRLLSSPAVAVVGSRRTDAYGLEAAELFGRQLAATGLTVLSGMALGIDGAAHRGALEAHGATAAVLGCGVDLVYPASHRRLARRIASSGALVSEFPLGTAPLPHHFPIRNRILAAWSVGTLVIRAAPRSGSLITAGQALDLGRLVWALPGNVFDTGSCGTNSLIRDGAMPVQSPAELLETLPVGIQDRIQPTTWAPPPLLPLSRPAEKVLAALTPDLPRRVDELAGVTGLPIDQALVAISELELAARARRHAGPTFTRRA